MAFILEVPSRACEPALGSLYDELPVFRQAIERYAPLVGTSGEDAATLLASGAGGDGAAAAVILCALGETLRACASVRGRSWASAPLRSSPVILQVLSLSRWLWPWPEGVPTETRLPSFGRTCGDRRAFEHDRSLDGLTRRERSRYLDRTRLPSAPDPGTLVARLLDGTDRESLRLGPELTMESPDESRAPLGARATRQLVPALRHTGRRRVPLPTYPFERKRYWIEPPGRSPSLVEDVQVNLRNRLEAAPEVERLPLMIEFLQGAVTGILGPHTPPPASDTNLFDLGLDSLHSDRHRSKVERRFGPRGTRIGPRRVSHDRFDLGATCLPRSA